LAELSPSLFKEYHEIAYLMNIVSLFLVIYGASCELLDALYAMKCNPMVNTYMWDRFGTDFAFFECLEKNSNVCILQGFIFEENILFIVLVPTQESITISF
jgi:hypothetical protein